MRHPLLPVLVLASTGLLAQQAAVPPIPPLTGVVFDHAPGVILAAADTWKAEFDATGATFVPFLGSDAPHNLPVRFTLAGLRVAGKAQPVDPGTPSRHANTIAITRARVREEYVAATAGIEQRFVFDKLQDRGELVVDIGIDGDFAVESHGDGYRFVHALGSFTYGKALAIDGNGRRIDLVTERTAHGLAITVPAAFVAEAALPLTIDPLVGNVVTVATANVALSAANLAFDATLQEYFLCWERAFSATDSDIWAQRLNTDLQPVGGMMTIDISSTSWQKCRVAGLNAHDCFLVVAEVAGSPSWIGGRILTAGAGLGAQFPIQQNSFANMVPDVGGDPNPTGPTQFCVCWEHAFSSIDHDIYYTTVSATGGVATVARVLDSSVGFEHGPRISKCNGQGNPASQTWAIAWRRDQNAQGHTRAGFVDRNGVARAFGTLTSKALTTSSSLVGPVGLAVSSPTDEAYGRVFLVLDTWLQSATQTLRATAVDRLGTILAADQAASYSWDPDLEPTIDCDGVRFGGAFAQQEAAQRSIVAVVFDLVLPNIARHEAAFATGNAESHRQPAIVAQHSGGAGPQGDREYALAWSRDAVPAVLAQRYRGMAGLGWGFRGTGCGPLSWSLGGYGAIAETITLQLNGATGLAGWAFGALVDVPLGFCPGCTQGTTADNVLIGATQQLAIPANGSLVGLEFALQGFDFGSGTCLGQIALSDTIDLRVR